MAMARDSRVRASFSMVMLPFVSAVVPRMMATLMGNGLYRRYSDPSMANQLDQVFPFRGHSFILPPSLRGSTKVPMPTVRDRSDFVGGDVAEDVGDDTLGEIIGQNFILEASFWSLGSQARCGRR